MENILFGVQVGNSILRRGEKTETFRSPFYNIRRLESIPYPPSLYPMDFRKGRAARIALGADAGGKPMLLWAEGAPKLGHIPGKTSCGASLHDMARLCSDAGMVNAVNLDGGGSAQILLSNRRSLEISDRKETDHSQAERPIPLGLILR
ncbi:MAG: phosphodiester glycosidase family protein [Oscillospiraceae bacterium]|nr:phosphodiester glycosidase family protein [Oscillospiraceae bacterium]